MTSRPTSTTRRIAAATLAFALVAGACGGSDDDGADQVDDTIDDDGDDVADENVDGEPGAATDSYVARTDLEAATAGMTDDQAAAFLNRLSDEDFAEITADLSDDEYDELIEMLDAAVEATDPPVADADPGDDATTDPEPEAAPEPAPTATRDDVDCSADGLGADETFAFTTAHVVVDGQLGAVCLGDTDQRITDAWDALATIAPAGQLADLGLFGGFEANEDSEEVTLAFVNTLDDDGTLFQMSVNLQAFEDDPDEAQLTMAHEFAHVFTQLPSQMDRTDEGIDNCTTYFNGDGCLYEDSILWQWIQLFWGADLIAQVDPTAENTSADGEQRCNDDAGFFGAYGASTPDEDFAEAFSAYVFDTGVTSDERRVRTDWIAAQPGLAEYRDRAVAAGLTGLPNNFESCGL